jgi:ABC-2 type transport system permease protein
LPAGRLGPVAVSPVNPILLARATVRRDWAIAVSYRLPFALDLVQTLAGMVLFYFLGSLVDATTVSEAPALEAGYFSFVIIGIVMVDIVSTSLTAFSDRLRADQTTGTFETLLTTPTPSWLVALTGASYQLLYASGKATVSLIVAVLFFGMEIDTGPGSLPAALVGFAAAIVLFSALGVAFAAYTVVFKRGSSLIGLATTGLALLGGVYFPISVLPDPLRAVGAVLPFTWAVDVARDALLYGTVAWRQLLVLVVVAIVLAPLACWLFDGAVNRARRAGTLTHF